MYLLDVRTGGSSGKEVGTGLQSWPPDVSTVEGPMSTGGSGQEGPLQ